MIGTRHADTAKSTGQHGPIHGIEVASGELRFTNNLRTRIDGSVRMHRYALSPRGVTIVNRAFAGVEGRTDGFEFTPHKWLPALEIEKFQHLADRS